MNVIKVKSISRSKRQEAVEVGSDMSLSSLDFYVPHLRK